MPLTLSPFLLPRIAAAFEERQTLRTTGEGKRKEKADGRDDDVDQDDDCPLDEKRDVFHALRRVVGERGWGVYSATLSPAFRCTEPHAVATGSKLQQLSQRRDRMPQRAHAQARTTVPAERAPTASGRPRCHCLRHTAQGDTK
ncbi:hypothetical protein MRX96_043805 [Rhipicephalus microplus]